MVLDRDAADFGETLVDLQVTTVRRQASKPDRRRVIDELQRRLRKQQDFGPRRLAAWPPLPISASLFSRGGLSLLVQDRLVAAWNGSGISASQASAPKLHRYRSISKRLTLSLPRHIIRSRRPLGATEWSGEAYRQRRLGRTPTRGGWARLGGQEHRCDAS